MRPNIIEHWFNFFFDREEFDRWRKAEKDLEEKLRSAGLTGDNFTINHLTRWAVFLAAIIMVLSICIYKILQ